MDINALFESRRLEEIYGTDESEILRQKERISKAVSSFTDRFGKEGDLHLFSAAGRSEIGGNHTDHQMGQVLAASLNIDSLAVAAATDDNIISLYSEGYETYHVDLKDLSPADSETGTTAALIRGVAAGFDKRGFKTGGFKAYVTSDVLGGSGLSSSASFESLCGAILSGLYNDNTVSTVDIAKIGQFSENIYLGKPCGLMDQMACSVGGFVHIDFANPDNKEAFSDDTYPKIERIDFDPSDYGYTLVITDTRASHADLTDDYAAIPAEMKKVAAFFGKEFLSQISEDEFMKNIPGIRKAAGDRAVMRAIHFFGENRRVGAEAEALCRGDFEAFLSSFASSARSSFEYLQNIYSDRYPDQQGVSIALAVSDLVLSSPQKGLSRVHGGGFAGTIQTFVKSEYTDEYIEAMDAVLGTGSAKKYSIRKYGAVMIV